nr:MAG TPA: hypothetical protein [Caudoviricetes sp.]
MLCYFTQERERIICSLNCSNSSSCFTLFIEFLFCCGFFT